MGPGVAGGECAPRSTNRRNGILTGLKILEAFRAIIPIRQCVFLG